jgi:3'-phosphoadenosine 5'-phosphosulfate sulfotransferase (PAPS reductase)/FAD synthetase
MIFEQRYTLPLEAKIIMSQQRIIDYYNHFQGNIYVSISGRDSTALLFLVRSVFKNVEGVFVNTGLEHPENVRFIKALENIEILKPAMSFRKIIEKYGYPVISKEVSCAVSRYRNTLDPVQKYRRLNGWPKGKKGMIPKKWQFLVNVSFKISDNCCYYLKEKPLLNYSKQHNSFPIMGMRADESNRRKRRYVQLGCNMFNQKHPQSWPIAFWSRQDVIDYLKLNNLSCSKAYEIENRTGCVFCLFGVQYDTIPNRIQRLKLHYPLLHKAAGRLGVFEIMKYLGLPYDI